MSYEFENKELKERFVVDVNDDGPFIACEDGAMTCVGLPTDLTEVQALIEAIINATGCELITTAKSMSGPVKLGPDGVAMVVKRDRRP